MKKCRIIIALGFCLALLSGCLESGRQRRAQLEELERRNRADSLMLNDSLAEALADYFDSHGTPNERMRARYILGRTYADLGEAPQALAAYQSAAQAADTSSDDCDYRSLSRVYGQMGKLFYQQNLMEECLAHSDFSIIYGLKGKDTLNAILSLGGKIGAYNRLHQPDSAIAVCEKVTSLLKAHGYDQLSAAYHSSVIRNLIEKDELGKARTYMDIFESGSGYFDTNHNIAKGRESYYYSKGLYYMARNDYDSAEYFFRKELRDGKDFNNQNGGAKGLALLFQERGKPDSAVKYALYSYAMNDSVYAQMATEEVEQAQQLYNYNRNQEIARQAKEKADAKDALLRRLQVIFALISVTIIAVVYRIHQVRKKEREDYKKKVTALANSQMEVTKLRSLSEQRQEELNHLIEKKQQEIERLTDEISRFEKNKPSGQTDVAKESLHESEIYQTVRKSADKAVMLTDEEWQAVYEIVIERLPGFNRFVSSKRLELNDKEFKTCILIRLHFTPKDVANLLGVTPAYISKIRNQMMQKLFGIDGKSKELDEKLMDLA